MGKKLLNKLKKLLCCPISVCVFWFLNALTAENYDYNYLNSDSRNKETLLLLPDFRNVEVSCFFKSLNSRQTQITSLSLIWSELLFMKLSDVKYILGYAFNDGDVFFIFSDWKLTNCKNVESWDLSRRRRSVSVKPKQKESKQNWSVFICSALPYMFYIDRRRKFRSMRIKIFIADLSWLSGLRPSGESTAVKTHVSQ